MILTNKFNYPDAVVKAAQNELYLPNKEILRVTELVDSPLIKKLTIEYWDKLSIDVDEIVYSSLFGTAWHKFLSGFRVDALIEKRWSINKNSTIITGQTDIYDPGKGIIEDNKTQSAWAFVFNNPSWERQLNCYAYLITENGYPANELWINSFLRDWSKFEAMKGRNFKYPKHKFHRIQVPLWSKTAQEIYINDRLQLHKAKDYVCNSEEKWTRPTIYRIEKKGRKSSLRNLPTKKEAQDYILATNLTSQVNSGIISIVEQKGGNVRCNDWCLVRGVCPYAKEN